MTGRAPDGDAPRATDAGARVLVTAGSTRLGALVVAALEDHPGVSTVIAVDEHAPAAPFRSAEFVRLRDDHAQLGRVARGAAIDVLVDARPAAALVPSDQRAPRDHRPVTDRVIEVCLDPGSTVDRLVVAGSAHRYGWGSHLPAFVTEEAPVPQTPGSPLQRSLAEIDAAVETLAEQRSDLAVSLLRIADPVGPGSAGLLQVLDRLPLFPTVLGFDPAVQVVHEDDAARAVAHVVGERLTGTYLVAADGTLALSEALRALGRPHAPVLPPWGTGLLSTLLQRAGVARAQDVAGLLRHGRGIDNRRLKATGFAYRATGREALVAAGAGKRRGRRALTASASGPSAPYEPEVEAFLRYSPSAQHEATPAAADERSGIAALDAEAILPLLPSLDEGALRALRAHEHAGPCRGRVIDEIDLLLSRR